MKIKIVPSFEPSLASAHTLILDSTQAVLYSSPFNSYLLSRYSQSARESLIHYSSTSSSNIADICEKLNFDIPIPFHFLLPSFQLSVDNPLTQSAILLCCLKAYCDEFPLTPTVTIVTSNICCISYLKQNYSVCMEASYYFHSYFYLSYKIKLLFFSIFRVLKYIWLSLTFKSKPPTSSNVVLVSPSIFSIFDNRIYSPYWDTFISSVFPNSDITHLFLFKSSPSSPLLQYPLHNFSPSANLLENNINILTLFRSLLQYLRIAFSLVSRDSLSNALPSNHPVSIFQIHNHNYYLSELFVHILQYNAYVNYFSFFSSPPLVLYLLEQRPSEFIIRSALFFVFRIDNSIGFQHTTIPYWDLRYINSCSSKHFPQYPSKCILSSSKYRNYLSSYGYPNKNLLAPYPFRFLSKNLTFKPKYSFSSDSSYFLVLLDFDPVENLNIRSLFTHLSDDFKSIKFLFKPHPASSCNFELPSNINGQLLSPSSNLNFLQFPIKGALCSNSTSAVLELLHSSIPCAVHHCLNRLNLSPLYYFTDFNNYISDSSHLQFFLSNLSTDSSAAKLIYTDLPSEPLSFNLFLS